jgi:cell division protein FtsZ
MIEFEPIPTTTSQIIRMSILGVGGGGGNTINGMQLESYNTIQCIAINTDAQALTTSKAPQKLQIGTKITRGLGAGANPELGKQAAQEDMNKILEMVQGTDIVFLTGGLGGGTGSGALPVIAHALKESNILTIAIVTKPFDFEGKKRMLVANKSLEQLKKEVDTLIIIPNQKLLQTTDSNISLLQAFGMINNIIHQCIKSIHDIIVNPGHINVDFADLKAIIQNKGLSLMGSGRATGQDRAIKATQEAITSPLLENMSIAGAQNILLNIAGSKNLELRELSAAASLIYEQAHPDATIILGSVIDDSLEDEVLVTLIATGLAQEMIQPAQPTLSMASQPTVTQHNTPIAINPLTGDTTQAIRTQELLDTAKINNFDDLEVPAMLRRAQQTKVIIQETESSEQLS